MTVRLPTGATIRPTTEEDRAALDAIAATVWNGNDYLPAVFDAWLEAPDSSFFVVEAPEPIADAGGAGTARVVGCARAAIVGPGQGWIEGVRVHPEARGRGYGDALVEHGTVWSRAHGAQATRMVTAHTNEPMTRIANRLGYRLAIRYIPAIASSQFRVSSFELPGSDSAPAEEQTAKGGSYDEPETRNPKLETRNRKPETRNLEPVPVEAVRGHWARLATSGLANAGGGFLVRGWHMWEMDVQRLEDAARAGRLYYLPSRRPSAISHQPSADGGQTGAASTHPSAPSPQYSRSAWVGAGVPRGLDLEFAGALGVLGMSDRGYLQLAWIGGTSEPIRDFGLAAREMAAARGVEAVTALIPEGSIVEAPLTAAGFAPRSEIRALLWEYRVEWC